MKKATTIEDIAAIVESTMKKETAVTFETGQVATEVMGITTRGDKGEAPVFDIGSWAKDRGFTVTENNSETEVN